MTTSVYPNDLLQNSVLSLPTLPTVFVTVLDQITHDDTSADDIAEIIKRDQSLASRLLAIANSPSYAFRGGVGTVSRAVALLGFNIIKNLVLSITVFDDLLEPKSIACFDKMKYWEHCLVCAAVAREIALQRGLSNPDEVYAAGLLHDVGKIVLDTGARQTYKNFLDDADRFGTCSPAFERRCLGTDHAEVAGALAAKWGLPQDISAAIRYHHEIPDSGLSPNQSDMTAVVAVADFICWTHGFGSIGTVYPPHLSKRVRETIQVDQLNIDEIYNAMDHQIKTTSKIFGLNLPDARRFREALMRANVELGHINFLYEETRQQLEQKVLELSSLNRAIYRIRQSLEVGATIRAFLETSREEFGFSRALFFKLKDGEISLHDFLADDNPGRDYSGLDSGLKESKLISSSLEGNGVVRVARATEINDDPLFVHLDTDELFLVPVQTKDGAFGLAILDSNRYESRPNTGSVELLDILAHEAGLAIENGLLFERTKELATKDELTQLYNRRYASEHLRAKLEQSKTNGHRLSIVIFDIDHFKDFNDSYGHQAGDAILQAVARLLENCSTETDVVARYGGEEFLVILPAMSTEEAEAYAERVRLTVEQYGKTKIEGLARTNLMISGGVATVDPERDTFETILARADKALYAAKQRGRNRTVVL